jgi:hypothetical protein
MSSTFVGKSFALHTQGKSVEMPKNKNKNKIVANKEKVLCISFFHIFQNLVIGMDRS